MAAKTQSMIKSKTRHNVRVDTQAEITRGALITMNVVGVVVGIWSLASLVGAMLLVGGPVALARAWFSAVTGL